MLKFKRKQLSALFLLSRIYKFPDDRLHIMYRRFDERCQPALNPTKCGVQLDKVTILPGISRTVPKIGHSPGIFS